MQRAGFDVVELGKERTTESLIQRFAESGWLSDHDLICDRYVLTQNVANQAKCVHRGGQFRVNNGIVQEQQPQEVSYIDDLGRTKSKVITLYPIKETIAQYEERMSRYYPWMLPQAKAAAVPLIFLQSLTADSIQHAALNQQFNEYGYTFAYKETHQPLTEATSLIQRYSAKRESALLTAFDPNQVQFKGFYNLKNIISDDHFNQQRFMACVFVDLKSNTEFLAINVCQDYGLVGRYMPDEVKTRSGAVHDIENILKHCRENHLALVMAGDFNGMPYDAHEQTPFVAISIDQTAEQAQLVKGLNHNIGWYTAKQVPASGACDALIYNEAFRNHILQERLSPLQQMGLFGNYRFSAEKAETPRATWKWPCNIL